MARASAIDENTVELRSDTVASGTAAASRLIDCVGRIVRRLQYADEPNPAWWKSLQFLAATALATGDTDCSYIDFVGCKQSERR